MKRLLSLSPTENKSGEQLPIMSGNNRQVKAARVAYNTRSNSTSALPDTNQAGSGQATSDVTSMELLIDKVSCGLCSAHINEGGITCSTCSRKYHSSQQCTGLKPLTIRCLQEEEDTALQYTCTNCRCRPVPSGSGNSDNGEWREAVGQVLEIVKSMASNMADMSRSVNMLLQSSQAPTAPNPPTNPQGVQVEGEAPISRNDLYAEMHEFEERRKRVSSIIVRGTEAQSVPEFTTKFTAVYEFLMNSPPHIAKVHCINPETKLFRVTLTDKNARVQLMNVTRNLKDSADYSNIYISRDLTKAQRTAIATKRANRPRRPAGERRPNPPGAMGSNATPSPPVSGANTTPIASASSDPGRNGARNTFR